jgi:hypothetical protein
MHKMYILSDSGIDKTTLGWRFTSVVECLPSMHKTLGSFPSTVKKKN